MFRAADVGSISASLASGKFGRLRSVDGTESERAFGTRAWTYELCGRMSRMRADGSENTSWRDEGESAVNAVGGRAAEEDDDDAVGGNERERDIKGGLDAGLESDDITDVNDG